MAPWDFYTINGISYQTCRYHGGKDGLLGCNAVGRYQRFGETCCLRLQGIKTQMTDTGEWHSVDF
jgi:hypothetical protein